MKKTTPRGPSPASTVATTYFKQSGLEWLGSAPVTWDRRVSNAPPGVLIELELWLDSICERAARLRGYLDGRHNSLLSHASAVAESNRLAAKVRRALGYTNSRNDLRF